MRIIDSYNLLQDKFHNDCRTTRLLKVKSDRDLITII